MTSINTTQQAMLQRMATMQAQAQQPLTAPGAQVDSRQSGSFGSVFHATMNAVDRPQKEAAELATRIETGASDDLTGAMISAQKASLSFSALTQVRNKLLNAYDEVMKMPL